MRFLVTADWHIRATKPRCRVDVDWIDTQKKALNQIADIAVKNNLEVFCVGDIFHANSDTNFQCLNLVQNFAKKLEKNGFSLCVLAGNHDLLYHSTANLDRSAIGVLLQSENIYPIAGVSDEITAPNFDEMPDGNAKFVFIHTLTFPDQKSVPYGVTEYETAETLLDKFPKAQWIFTGDYHKNFHVKIDGRHVVNSGCLLRQASDFRDYICGVYLIDTDEGKCEWVPLEDDLDLVDDSYIVKEQQREEQIENFVNELASMDGITLDFEENVKKELTKNTFSPELKNTINNLMEG